MGETTKKLGALDGDALRAYLELEIATLCRQCETAPAYLRDHLAAHVSALGSLANKLEKFAVPRAEKPLHVIRSYTRSVYRNLWVDGHSGGA